MKRVLAVGVSGVLVIVLALVVFGPARPSCSPTPLYAGGDTTGLDVPAEPVPVTTTAPFTARIATWNTLYKNSTARVTAGVTTIAGQADVIGLQEFNPASRRASVARVMAKRGWGMTDGNNSVQIFYNAAKYKLLAQDSVKVIDVVRIEGGTAGTSIGPKSLQWVQLQDRTTGGVFFVLNMHIVPDIDRKGHPRKAPKRLAVRDKQRATALSVIAKLRKHGPVAWTEDSNVDNRNDQRVKSPRFDYRQMKAAGMSSNWSALGIPTYGTQSSGRRVIDKVSLTLENGRFLTQRRLGTYGSDHHAVVATIGRRGAAAAPVETTTVAAAPALPASLTVPGWKLDSRPDPGRRHRDRGRQAARHPRTRLGRGDRGRAHRVRDAQPRPRRPRLRRALADAALDRLGNCRADPQPHPRRPRLLRPRRAHAQPWPGRHLVVGSS